MNQTERQIAASLADLLTEAPDLDAAELGEEAFDLLADIGYTGESEVLTFDRAGVMTTDAGVVIPLNDGTSVYLTVRIQ